MHRSNFLSAPVRPRRSTGYLLDLLEALVLQRVITIREENRKKRGFERLNMGCTFIGSPVARHAVAEESDSRQLGHRLDDVEVAERADLEEGHVVLCGEVLRVRLAHFAPEGKVQSVANQDLGNARCVLKYKSNSHKHLRSTC